MAEVNSVEKGVYIQNLPVSPTGSTTESGFDSDAERRLIRKLDLRILPVLWVLYLINFIDR
jgi:hypothetical protein